MKTEISIPVADNPAHVDNLRSIPLLKSQGFEGSDASLSESLFEYGMAWRDLGDEWLVIYRHTSIRKAFDRCTISKSYDVQKEHDWVKFGEIANFCGCTVEQWHSLPVLHKLADLVRHEGTEEIFGTSYWQGFTISEE